MTTTTATANPNRPPRNKMSDEPESRVNPIERTRSAPIAAYLESDARTRRPNRAAE